MRSTTMRPERNERSRHGKGAGAAAAAWAVLAALLLPALYVLSVGPAILAVNRGRGQEWVRRSLPALERFYRPVEWLHDETPLKRPLEGYLNWWYAAAAERRR